MSSDSATSAAAARVDADPVDAEPDRSLADLIAVLDRADGAGTHQRARARRPSADRAEAYRRGAVRRAPLRSVPTAPPARTALGGTVAPESPAAAPPQGWRHGLVRRAALWGSGPDGEYLAWPAARAPGRRPAPARRPSRLRGLARRLARWGAGLDGAYLAWASGGSSTAGGRSGPSPGRPADVNPPVVLREMPSTGPIQPAASSPAAALLPRGPASSAGPQGARPVPSGAVPVPGVGPRGRSELSPATGWPSPARPSPAANGLVRARGDPLARPVRCASPPERRAGSPGSARNSFPPGPVPRSGTDTFASDRTTCDHGSVSLEAALRSARTCRSVTLFLGDR